MSISSGPAAPVPAQPPLGGRSHLIAGVRIIGEFSAPGLVELSGHVEGRVTADSVTVEQQGSIEGEVEGATVAIKGHFDGRLTGGAVRIHATARVTGTVLYETLSIESGAEVTAAFHRTTLAT